MKDEERKKIELNDDDLNAVAGGTCIDDLKDWQMDYANRCPCEGCLTDSLWVISSTDVICSHCGAIQTRQWYDENKIRNK